MCQKEKQTDGEEDSTYEGSSASKNIDGEAIFGSSESKEECSRRKREERHCEFSSSTFPLDEEGRQDTSEDSKGSLVGVGGCGERDFRTERGRRARERT